MNLVKRLFQHGVDRFKRGKGCEAQRGKAVWQHQSDAKQGALRDLTFRTEANMQAINMLIDSPSWRPNWWLLSVCARRSQPAIANPAQHYTAAAAVGGTTVYRTTVTVDR